MPQKLGIPMLQKGMPAKQPLISSKLKDIIENTPSAPAVAAKRGRKKLPIEDIQEMAEKRGGKCLSKRYIDNKTKLKWQCGKGHIWKAIPNSIRQGHWCPRCFYETIRPRSMLTIEEMHKMARKKGGKCLSKEYRGSFTKLKWQCSKGHIWRAIPHHIRQGHWCPHCAHESRRTKKDMQKIARERGGKCLSAVYAGTHSKLKWQCGKGHEWEARPENIKRGSWCPQCAAEARGINKRLTLRQMRRIARKRGGKCLSTVYASTLSNLRWQCRKRHEWEAAPHNIIYQGSWCPHCSREKRSAHKVAKNAAKKKGKARKR
jgi:thiol-disulfide isomerase/thioredoxin